MGRSYYKIEGDVSGKEFDFVLKECEMQRKLPQKYKLPTFDCPVCGAKKILFAGDKVSKNETVLEQFREHGIADYVIICPKCRNYIAVRRQASKESAGLMFRTQPGIRAFGYLTVYNGRVRGIYHTKPHSELIFEGEYAPEHPAKEIPYARVIHAKKDPPQWYR